MDLVWLQDFIALTEAGSFSGAARLRNVTQPAFSRRVKSLEEWVGAPLFDRTAHGATLTAAGHVFARTAPDLVAQITGLQTRTREAGQRASHTLQFTATQTLSFAFFPEWIRRASDRFDLGLVQLSTANMTICVEIMAQGKADFLLCHAHPIIEDPFEGRLPSVSIGEDRMIAVCGRRADGGSHWPPAKGAAVPYLGYGAPSGIGRIVAACEPALMADFERRTIFTSHLAAALRQLAVDGEGIAWLPLSLIRDDLDTGRLTKIFDDEREIAIEIRLFRSLRLGEAAERFWKRFGMTEPYTLPCRQS